MKKILTLIGGVALGVFGTVVLVVILYANGVIAVNLPVTTTTAPATAIAIPNPVPSVEATRHPTETATIPVTITPTRTQTLVPTDTLTPTPPARNCNHTKGVYVLITVEQGKAVFRSNDDCLMMSVNGLGKPVFGEIQNSEIEVLGRKYNPHYKFTCTINNVRTASCGLYLEELLFTEFAINDIGWTHEYKLGEYAHFMIFATQTPPNP